jgi:hypothetical protein
LYDYSVHAVDAERDPSAEPISSGGLVTTGVALVSHSIIYLDQFGSPSGYQIHSPCPQECLGGGLLVHPIPDELLRYVDTGTPLLLYGEVVGVTLAYNFWFPVIRIDCARESDCVVNVEPRAWSSIKRLYQ